MAAIIKKELRAYFNSWIGYIFLLILVGLVGVFFWQINIRSQIADFQLTLGNLPIFLLILIPVLTMRLFAEEARQKTDQLLFTAPVTVSSVVLAKFFSAFLLVCIALVITLVFPFMLSFYGDLPYSEIFTVYIGFALLIPCFIAVGMFISACTENQIIAAVITFFVMIFLYIMEAIVSFINDSVTASQAIGSSALISLIFIAIIIALLAYIIYDSTKNYYIAGGLALILISLSTGLYAYDTTIFDVMLVRGTQWLSIMTRFDNFNHGVLNVSDIIYYISFAGAFVYLTINVIEKRRWK